MDIRNIFIVGGSSGIGLELVKVLNDDLHEVYVGSRSNKTLAAEFAPRIRVNAIFLIDISNQFQNRRSPR